jgi:prepilin-type processing-associated H-X9-DG protein
MYVSDNAAKLPSLTLGKNLSNVGGYWEVSANSLTWPNSIAAMAEVQIDLMTNSLLFAYFPSVAVNHCPGDPRSNNPLGTTNTLARGWAYDSYAFTQNVSGVAGVPGFTHITDIRRISDCLIVAERVDSRGCNLGPFQSNTGGGYAGQEFSSLFGIYHGKVGTFSFADGHAEGHKWTDANIIKSGLAANQPGVIAYYYGQAATPYPSATGLDATWVRQHWVNLANP